MGTAFAAEATHIVETGHLSVADVARATGANETTVRAWLRGARSPSGARAERLPPHPPAAGRPPARGAPRGGARRAQRPRRAPRSGDGPRVGAGGAAKARAAARRRKAS